MIFSPRALIPVVISVVFAGCGNDSLPGQMTPQSPGLAASAYETPAFPSNPGDFVPEIDNPYLGFARGKVFHYESKTADGIETNVVEVTDQDRTILGIASTVVHDQVRLDGNLVEDTYDWYAQDKDGNVWYLGEDSKQIANGVVVGTEGSWEAGIAGATAGVVMLAHPRIGVQYLQEFAEGVAEDQARVLSLSKIIDVTYGTYDSCLQTMEWTPLEPGAREFKFYAPGVGMILELQPRGGRIRAELIAVED